MHAALALALAVAPFACNALWGIDAATLASDGGAHDGPKGDGPAPDGSSMDAGSDGRPIDARSPDAPPDAPSYFDGYCMTGSGLVTLVEDPYQPTELVSDEGGVYWTNFSSGSLGLLRFGSPPTIAFAGDAGEYPEGVFVADGQLVWVASGLGILFHCPAAGCMGAQVLATEQASVGFVVANATNAYWETTNAINTCTLPSCPAGPVVVAAGVTLVSGLAIDSAYLYWSDGTSMIYSTSLVGGGSIQTVVAGESSPTRLTAQNGSLYWSAFGGVRTCVLSTGICGTVTTLVGGIDPPTALVVDDRNVYFANSIVGTIGRATLDGGIPEAGMTSPLYVTPQVAGLSVGESCLFWSEEGDAGAIMAGPK
jgi:hypothetical protein